MKAYHFREAVTAWYHCVLARSFAQVRCSWECTTLMLVTSPPGWATWKRYAIISASIMAPRRFY